MVFESIKPVVDILAKLGMTPGDIIRSIPTIGMLVLMIKMFVLMIKWDKRLTISTENNKNQFTFLGKEQEKTNTKLDDHEKRIGKNEIRYENLADIFDKLKKGHDNA